ncbi:Hypothetical_protein [Hexamita inflata]|uniref:Hypothetical_protein n=1 Tax=Hexamita inflata TaxID=28002 RepID=A0AA86V5R5_9EUKA|nr:Hypothetical protein HINF_LOCUS64967 [Hexamita inflata]
MNKLPNVLKPIKSTNQLQQKPYIPSAQHGKKYLQVCKISTNLKQCSSQYSSSSDLTQRIYQTEVNINEYSSQKITQLQSDIQFNSFQLKMMLKQCIQVNNYNEQIADKIRLLEQMSLQQYRRCIQ